MLFVIRFHELIKLKKKNILSRFFFFTKLLLLLIITDKLTDYTCNRNNRESRDLCKKCNLDQAAD